MIVADLSKEEDTIRAVEETIKFYGQLHVLVSIEDDVLFPLNELTKNI